MTTGLRDWDVMEAIRDALDATGAFDVVALSPDPADWGQSAVGRMATVVRDSFDDTDAWDDAAGVSIPRRVVYLLTVYARDADQQARERDIDRLCNICQNTLDGVSLAGLTLPGLTKIRRGKLVRAEPPERRAVLTGEFTYLVDGFGGHDTTD